MIVTLDGCRLEDDYTPGCTLQAVIDRVRDQRLNDRLVISVAVNGEHFVGGDLEEGLMQRLSAEDQVDLESGDRFAIAADALRNLAGELAEVGRLQPMLADQLDAGDAEGAVREVGEFVRTWSACGTAVVQCSGLVGRDLTAVELDGRCVGLMVQDLVTKLRALRDALDARDLVMLADLMHYELPPLCEEWQSALLRLADEVERQTPAPASTNG
jgi:hypothetical protein